MNRILAAAILMLSGCSSIATAPRAPAFDVAAVDSLFDQAVKSGAHIGIAALVFDEGEIVYAGTFGLRDRERNQPVEIDTVWRIYSMTKPVTSVVILDLLEDGKLKLTDPVSKYIPELGDMQVANINGDGQISFEAQSTPMTLEDLLLHRAGIGYGFNAVDPVDKMYGEADLFNVSEHLSVKMRKLSNLPLLTQPGERWYYSYATDVLGRVAEIIEGKSLGEVMEERIFSPLGMDDTGFQVQPAQKARFATNYFLQEDGAYTVEDDGQYSTFLDANAFQSGGGGLVSTLGDYAKFAEMLLDGGAYNGGRILDETTVDMMMTNHLDAGSMFDIPWLDDMTNIGFGYGGSVIVADTPEQLAERGESVGQFAWSGAARTMFWIDRPNDAFGILMLQYFGQKDPVLQVQFRVLANAETFDAVKD